MKCFLLLLLGVIGVSCVEPEIFMFRHGIRDPDPPNARARSPIWRTFEQPLDNFDASNTKRWNMRYIYNDQFYRTGGPIFMMLGAEWTIDGGWLQSGQMYDLAQQHGGLMFYTEHRYYGKSFPTSDLSPANLKYLTTPQALADLANMCRQMKQELGGKIVVFGGSYGGNMAIWMREKYPDLVHCALSSSAPVLAKTDFLEYYEVVNDALSSCVGTIKGAIATTIQIMNSPGGAQKIQRDFNTCQPVKLDDKDDVEYFFMSLMGTIGGQIQYANSNTVNQICNALSNPPSLDDYSRFTAYIRQQRVDGCVGDYDNFVSYFADWSLNRGDSRQWIYQTCTQYGYFQTSDSENQPFGHTVPVDMFYSWCRDIFGPGFTSQVVNNGVATTNSIYGGLNPQTSRVVSVHGSLDPWHRLGLSRSLGSDMPVYFVQGTSHTADMSSISSSDSPQMREAKLAVQKHITEWLKEP